MCGVFAVLSRGGAPLPADCERRASKALDVLRSRGPDGAGMALCDRGRVLLAHRRLAVVAPDCGAQPISTLDRQVWAVVNGELYGEPELRGALVKSGHRFTTGGDSELVLHLYREHGLDFFDRLQGEFAFVLWDATRQRLIAARDRFGVKPLVWAQQGNSILVASEAKALFAFGFEPVWDEVSLRHAATHQYLPEDKTLFAGVHPVRPGTAMLWQAGRQSEHRFWQLSFARSEDPVLSDEDAANQLRQGLDDAVRTRLRGDVPVAFALSGGLDSSSVVALASRHLYGAAPCFGLHFDEAGYDENAAAARVAGDLGATYEPVSASRDELLEVLFDAAIGAEGLAVNGQLPAKYLLNRAIHSAGYKVVLTGEGADELLFGYPHLQRDEYPGEAPVPGAGTAGIMLPVGEVPVLQAVQELLGYVPTFLQAKVGIGRDFRHLFRSDVTADIDEGRVLADLLGRSDVRAACRGRSAGACSSWLWSKLALAGYILRTLGDGTEMRWSVEGRTPFLDTGFTVVATRISAARQIREGSGKRLLRYGMHGLLPEVVLNRPKQPLLAPPMLWKANGAVDERVADLVRSSAAREVPFLDSDKIQLALQESARLLPVERARREPALMMALCAIALQQHYRPAWNRDGP